MIVSPSLLGIAEDLVGAHDPAEFKSGIRVFRINIGMGPLDRATECSPQIIGIIVRKRAEQIVKRLHGNALAVGFLIHLEFSAAKSPKEHALVLSMIPFSAGHKNDGTVHNANGTRLLLLNSRSFFARTSPGFDSVVTLPIRLHVLDDRESRRGPLGVRCNNSKRRQAV